MSETRFESIAFPKVKSMFSWFPSKNIILTLGNVTFLKHVFDNSGNQVFSLWNLVSWDVENTFQEYCIPYSWNQKRLDGRKFFKPDELDKTYFLELIIKNLLELINSPDEQLRQEFQLTYSYQEFLSPFDAAREARRGEILKTYPLSSRIPGIYFTRRAKRSAENLGVFFIGK